MRLVAVAERTLDAESVLTGEIVRQAVKDTRAGHPCGRHCNVHGHACRGDALRFLRPEWCYALLCYLGLGDAQGWIVERALNG